MAALLAAMPVRAEDATTTFVADGLTREQALAQLLSGTGIKVEFASNALASAPLQGSITAKREAIVAWLLSSTSYAISYDGATGEARRIVVANAGTGTAATSIEDSPSPASTKLSDSASAKRKAALSRAKLDHMKASNEALRRRLAELPPGRHIIRTQAIRAGAGALPGQTGNVPIFVGVPLAP
jgi:hypothetical protein